MTAPANVNTGIEEAGPGWAVSAANVNTGIEEVGPDVPVRRGRRRCASRVALTAIVAVNAGRDAVAELRVAFTRDVTRTRPLNARR